MSNITRVRGLEFSALPANTLDPVVWTPLWESIDEACFMIRITNASANTVFISFDSSAAHIPNDIILPNGVFELYCQNNASYSEKSANIGKGTSIFVRGTPALIGFIAATGYTYVKNH